MYLLKTGSSDNGQHTFKKSFFNIIIKHELKLIYPHYIGRPILSQIVKYASHINLEVVFDSYCQRLQNILQHESKYRVIKMSLCTWWLQYRKLQVMFKLSPNQSPDIFWHAELYSWRPCSVQHGPHSECILWWPSSTHQLCGDCSNTLSFSSQPRQKNRAEKDPEILEDIWF